LPAPTPAPEIYEDRNPPGWISGIGPDSTVSLFFDPRFHPPSGWFANADVGVVGFRFVNHLQGPVSAGVASPITSYAPSSTIPWPRSSLDWTALPRIGVGYRFKQMGEVTLTYQAIVSQGQNQLGNFGGVTNFNNGVTIISPSTGPATLRSRVNFNILDLDYGSSEISLAPVFDMKWRVGVRYANIYFDTASTGPVYSQSTSSIFNGAGPHAGLDLQRPLPYPGLALFGRLEGSVLVGPADQKFRTSQVLPGGTVLNGFGTSHHVVDADAFTNTANPITLILEGGLSYTPTLASHWLRLSAVYHFEQWWDLGFNQMSDANLTIQGVFFKAELKY
jgi:hypothetical protein